MPLAGAILSEYSQLDSLASGELGQLFQLVAYFALKTCCQVPAVVPLVPIGRTSACPLPGLRKAPALGLETILSQREVEYPAMLQMHDASSLGSEEEVRLWRGKQPVPPSSALTGEAVRHEPFPEGEQPKDTIEQVILRRGSTRTFDKTASITLAQLFTSR
jgi:hypothetical protein